MGKTKSLHDRFLLKIFLYRPARDKVDLELIMSILAHDKNKLEAAALIGSRSVFYMKIASKRKSGRLVYLKKAIFYLVILFQCDIINIFML